VGDVFCWDVLGVSIVVIGFDCVWEGFGFEEWERVVDCDFYGDLLFTVYVLYYQVGGGERY